MLRTLGVRTSLNYGDHSTPLMARRAFVLWLALQCDVSSFFWGVFGDPCHDLGCHDQFIRFEV